MLELNKDLLRWLILIGAIPIWWPFLRTLWKDFNEALKDEGGLFGSTPTQRELDEIREGRAGAPENLVSEPWVRAGERRNPRMKSAGTTRGGPSGSGGPPLAGRSSPGFRTNPTEAGQRPRGFR